MCPIKELNDQIDMSQLQELGYEILLSRSCEDAWGYIGKYLQMPRWVSMTWLHIHKGFSHLKGNAEYYDIITMASL